MMITSSAEGTIFQIQRWSLHDGEGIRSTIFLKGCPLRCRWCANPESWSHEPQFMCSPTGEIKEVGSQMSVHKVMEIIKRDAVFYRESGGGVTFSGGEPFYQVDFLRQLVINCQKNGINTAVETSGYFDLSQVKDIIQELDEIFIDCKHMDDQVHQQYTGVSNKKILKNIAEISKIHSNVVVRVPFIPDINTEASHLRQMCHFLQTQTQIRGVELLPYHKLGTFKYPALGFEESQVFTVPDDQTMEGAKKIIAEYGLTVLESR